MQKSIARLTFLLLKEFGNQNLSYEERLLDFIRDSFLGDLKIKIIERFYFNSEESREETLEKWIRGDFHLSNAEDQGIAFSIAIAAFLVVASFLQG